MLKKTDDEWKQQLTELEYHVLRNRGTERAFTGEYVDYHENGMYHCRGCGAELFSSETKYNSGSGWPSFWEVANKENIQINHDFSHGMMREEVICKQCGSHLGHVFADGPNPTGLRYCMNSISLKFEKK